MNSFERRKSKTVLLLCDIRSVENVGAIFRTADACGVSEIILGGYTPAPLDRFGRPRKDLAKAALGAETFIPWRAEKNSLTVIKKMKGEGFLAVAVEQSPKAVDYKTVEIKGKNSLIILGNEVDGISPAIIEEADIVVQITMLGHKKSLNVSVATGIVLYRLLNI